MFIQVLYKFKHPPVLALATSGYLNHSDLEGLNNGQIVFVYVKIWLHIILRTFRVEPTLQHFCSLCVLACIFTTREVLLEDRNK